MRSSSFDFTYLIAVKISHNSSKKSLYLKKKKIKFGVTSNGNDSETIVRAVPTFLIPISIAIVLLIRGLRQKILAII